MAQLFITWGVRWSLASNAALLMLTLPISTAVMAYFFLGERMTRVRWISFALALVGVMECSGVDWKELNFTSVKFLLGNLMIFLSVNGSAFYNVYSKKLLRRYSPLQVLLYSYYAVFAFLCPITVYAEPQGFINLPHYNTTVWLGLVMLAIFQYFLSMVIFLNVLTRLDATQAAVSNYLIPFFGVVVAAIVLHERLTKFMVVRRHTGPRQHPAGNGVRGAPTRARNRRCRIRRQVRHGAQLWGARPAPKPPSTTTADPVMKEASSLARKTATRPTSSGLPILHKAWSFPAAARAAAGSGCASK